MKTLYITDLDGTLLNSNSMLSEYTIKTLARLIENGMCFSYATVRSLSEALIVTRELTINIPVIIYNGTFIVNPITREKFFSLSFKEQEKNTVIKFFTDHSIYPLVHGYINGEEKVSWIKTKENNEIINYRDSRKGDKRLRTVENMQELYEGELFFFTCISDRKEQLTLIHEYFKDRQEFNCTLQKEPSIEEYWCEIMPKKATKGNAILELKKILGCDKIVSFGDGTNDISMFEVSDEKYAVENAVDELKEYADKIIMSNDKDGVAHWLGKNYNQNEVHKYI